MAHNFETQRRETYATFKEAGKSVKLPKEAVVEYLFFIEELDASWAKLEADFRSAGYVPRRDKDGITLIAAYGPIAVTPEAIWEHERNATSIALKHDFYPDGWVLAE